MPGHPAPGSLRRLPLLLAATCLGSGGILLIGRHLLRLQPPLTPELKAADLQRIWRLDPDPTRRREAALLLSRSSHSTDDNPRQQRLWLRHQGWGDDPLAAVVLKREAQAAERLGDSSGASQLWTNLLQRFPADPASADALFALGRNDAQLRQRLLQAFPAHPAALAAALEQGSAGAGHLARWGERWPGADAVLRQRCASTAPPLQAAERDQLAASLARLGQIGPALRCLGDQPGQPETRLALAKAMLRDPDQEAAAEAQLAALARQAPSSASAQEAVRLLAEGRSAASLEALQQLPASLRQSAPVQARLALQSKDLPAALAVLRRWPADPASWELQWQRARQLALAGDWAGSLQVLAEPSLLGQLPPLLESRRRFWQGLAAWELGDRQEARRHWQELLHHHPGGYYGWRAAVRLGQGELAFSTPAGNANGLQATPWSPLNSGDPQLEQLWRLDQRLEAWERWRLQTQGISPSDPARLTVEGRLRRGVGDHWLGLGQLEQASLRLPPQQCLLAQTLERELHAPAHRKALEQASRAAALPSPLLAAIAKQESRFSATVRSPVGAVGLLQLMPTTAAEVAGADVSDAELEQPERNAELGGLYLRALFNQWQGNPLLAVASYNAGPGAVAGWIDPRLNGQPELWVEAIPYPETRLYVKKVLGNLWSMTAPRPPACTPLNAPASGPARPLPAPPR
jgi:soluble lytic murein transglycosylase